MNKGKDGVRVYQRQLNLIVVDPLTGLALRRPWVTLIVDTDSGLMLDIYVSQKQAKAKTCKTEPREEG